MNPVSEVEVAGKSNNKPENNVDVEKPHPASSSITAFSSKGIFSPGGFLSSISKLQDQDEMQESATSSDVGFAKPNYKTNRSPEIDVTEAHRENTATTSDQSFSDIALAIDHIAESIFNALSFSDLLNCRLVCHSWKLFSTPCLQKRTMVHVCNTSFGPLRRIRTHTHSGRKHHRNKSLEGLLSLLMRVDPPSSFPCNNFSITGGNLDNHLLHHFLHLQGFHIQHLTLSCYFEENCDPTEIRLVEQVQNLITVQVPFLKSLILPLRIMGDPKKFLAIAEEKSSRRIKKTDFVSSKLKLLGLDDGATPNFIKRIIEICPNLEEIDLSDCTNFLLYQPYLFRYVKKLIVNPFEGRIDELERIVSQQEKGNFVHLREIAFHFKETGWTREFGKPNFDNRVGNAVSAFLEHGARSIETITWDGIFPLGTITWPHIMPQVRSLRLGNPHGLEYDEQGVEFPESPNLFPKGFQFSKVFPKLNHVYLYADVWGQIFSIFMNCLKFDRVDSVRNVNIYWIHGGWVSEHVMEDVRKLFPNATVVRGRC